jgi:hypothetical protein
METGTTEERLEKLEHTARRYRLVLTGLGIAILACVVTWVVIGTSGRAQAQKPAETDKVVRAREFILEDEKGETRATLALDAGGPSLSLVGGEGKGGVALAATPLGPTLMLVDGKDKIRVMLSVSEGAPMLWLYDKSGNRRAGLAVFEDQPVLALQDEKGQARVGLVVRADGPGLNLYDEKGNSIWRAP